jgi:hypothetical protein
VLKGEPFKSERARLPGERGLAARILTENASDVYGKQRLDKRRGVIKGDEAARINNKAGILSLLCLCDT